MKGTRPLTGPALTNDLCGQYLKIKVKVNVFISALAKTSAVFDFDFNILTALKGWVGHAPQRRGALHIIIFLLLFDFTAARNVFYSGRRFLFAAIQKYGRGAGL